MATRSHKWLLTWRDLLFTVTCIAFSFGLLYFGTGHWKPQSFPFEAMACTVGLLAGVGFYLKVTRVGRRSTQKKVNRQLSLKELFGLVTYFALVAGTLRFGMTFRDPYFTWSGVLMLLMGTGGLLGFIINGRPGLADGVTAVLIALAVAWFCLTMAY